jgi:hypothetical protein
MKYWYNEIWWNSELMNLKVDKIKWCYNYQFVNLSLIENDKLTRRDKNLGIDELANRRVDELMKRRGAISSAFDVSGRKKVTTGT